MNEIKNLEPQIVWKNFHALTRVPRPSGHLEKVQQFLLDWAAAHGIEAFKDKGRPHRNLHRRRVGESQGDDLGLGRRNGGGGHYGRDGRR